MLNWTIICDFDGTIATDDVTDLLLERFASAQWREVELEWQAGRIDSRECLRRQAELLRVNPSTLQLELATVAIDPEFHRFVSSAQNAGCDVRIASEGFDRVIHTLLAGAQVPSLPLAATHLSHVAPDRWVLDFPFAKPDCRTRAATCKCSFAEQAMRAHGRDYLVLIGDGLSDHCLAGRADLVLARGRLLEHCREQSIRHEAAADFSAVLQYLEPIFNEARRAAITSKHSSELDHV